MKLKHLLRYLVTHDTTWHGEFAALWPLLRECGAGRLVVDVGANDGFYSSNSYPFIKRGWQAILIEPHPAAFERALRLHAGNKRVAVLCKACGEKHEKISLALFEGDEDGTHSTLSTPERHHSDRRVEKEITLDVEPLESILESQRVAPIFDLLTIDTEGHDYRVLLGLGRFRPRVIITESGTTNIKKFDLLQALGYRLHKTLENDTIWMIHE